MFDEDFWGEIWETITHQKWRSLMTAFGVFWGMFMLVILISAGMGLNNGIIASYTNLPANALYIGASETTMPYLGIESGRKWNFVNQDVQSLANQFPDHIKGFSTLTNSLQQNNNMALSEYGSGLFELAGVDPNYLVVAPQKVVLGRYINDTDIEQGRNVCVLGENVRQALFGDENPLAQEISVNEKIYKVVGVCKCTNDKLSFGVDLPNGILVPRTVMQTLIGEPDYIDFMTVILNDNVDADKAQIDILTYIKSLHQIHPEDESAINIFNMKIYLGMINSIFIGISILIWIVGIGTLLAGLIGISNIMMVTVKERTQEIGVRRALGAQPWTIIKQIMCESLVLTSIAGSMGLFVGLWLVRFIGFATSGLDGGVFTNPYIPFGAAITCLVILIAGGLFAGFIPARRAMGIKAIEALREE